MTRLDSRLEAAGAEFLVLGHLLIERIHAFKAYTNFPGYDVVAANLENGLTCKIQVKSRWQTNHGGGFPIHNYDCDFVVFVALNRGLRYSGVKPDPLRGRKEPQFYVFPVEIVRGIRDPDSPLGKVFLRNMDMPEQYIDRWDLIQTFLRIDATPTGAGEDMQDEEVET